MALRLLRAGVNAEHHYMRDCSRLFDTGEQFPTVARAEREVLPLTAYPELSDRRIDRIADKIRRAVTMIGAA